MATKRSTVSQQPRVFKLNISNGEFEDRLNQRISIGEELSSRNIQTQDEYAILKNDVDAWNDYNFEMLKQVFNYPDNDYRDAYNDAGYTFLGQMGEVKNDEVATKKNLINYKLLNLKSLLGKASLIKSEIEKDNLAAKAVRQISMNEVFIVHGHDDLAKIETARFIEKLGFKPIILHEQASSGKTIIEKIEHYSNIGFGIILYTPCDLGGKTKESLKSRARQNVVFEHGYLIGKIGRDKVCALVKGDIETPNDISGVVYISMDSSNWQFDVAKELRNSGYDVDMNRI